MTGVGSGDDGGSFGGMVSLRPGYVAVVVGSTGGLGSAVLAVLRDDPLCSFAVGLSRSVGLDVLDEGSIERCAGGVCALHGEIDLLFVATGVLSVGAGGPERSMRSWSSASMLGAYAVNAVGPGLVLKHFGGLLPRARRCAVGVVSARLGSIGDNGLGGWVSYRASKAGLHQIVRTASIELGRRCPGLVVASLHPGTVRTEFSAGRGAGLARREPLAAARMCLRVLDELPVSRSGGVFDAHGAAIAF